MRLKILLARIRALFQQQPDLDDEIATHISLLAEEHERRGMSPAAAALAARRELGGVTQIRETWREQRRPPVVDSIAQDVRYALRQLRRSPAFTFAAVATLALGIGANTAVFRALDAVLLRPLPVRNAASLVHLQPLHQGTAITFTGASYQDLLTHQRSVDGLFASGEMWPRDVAIAGGPALHIKEGRFVTGAYFESLGVDAALGRLLAESDDRPAAPPVVVIPYKTWDRDFHRSPDAIGKVLQIDALAATIVGVTAKGFEGERRLFTPEFYVPLSVQPRLMPGMAANGNFSFLDVMARLRPGVTATLAQAELDPLYRRLDSTAQPSERNQYRLRVVSASRGLILDQIQDSVGKPLWVLMATVGLVLIIACCNLANLLLGRGASRAHEIGVRLALGAGRRRLIRQLLTETLMLSAMGAAGGAILAGWGTRVLLAWVTDGEMATGAVLGWRVLAFLAAVAAAATALFGLVPALSSTRLDIRSALQANWHTQSRRILKRRRIGKAFVIAQVSLCLMLLSGASLLFRSLWNLQHQNWGFRAEGLLLAERPVDWRDFGDPRTDYFTRLRAPLLEQLGVLPGVQSVAVMQGGPLGNFSNTTALATPARALPSTRQARIIHGSAGFLDVLGIPILSGRGISAADRANTAKVVVLGQTAARLLFDTADPIGRYVSLNGQFNTKDAVQIVGIAADIKFQSPREPAVPVVYAAIEQSPQSFNTVILRSQTSLDTLAAAVRAALKPIDSDFAKGNIATANDILDDRLSEEQSLAAIGAGFGILALLLASIGVYGVIAYAVRRRTHEMGIRMALGATGGEVTRLVMLEAGALPAIGVAIGGALSAGAAQLLHSMLFGLTAVDAAWVIACAALVVAVSAGAAYVPARRASRIDPVEALRVG